MIRVFACLLFEIDTGRQGREGNSFRLRRCRSAAPFRPISELEFRSMEPPCSAFKPENGLEAGLPLIHPEPKIRH